MNLGLEEYACTLKTWESGGQRIEKFKVKMKPGWSTQDPISKQQAGN